MRNELDKTGAEVAKIVTELRHEGWESVADDVEELGTDVTLTRLGRLMGESGDPDWADAISIIVDPTYYQNRRRGL